MRKSKNPTEPLLIDLKQVCGLLGISHQHFYNMRATGRFPVPFIRLGRSVRYNKKHIQNWIDKGCRADWRPPR